MAETRELTPEEIAANVKAAEAEAEKNLAEARKFDQETKVAELAAQKAEHELEVSRIARDAALRSEKNNLATDDLHHVYYFTSDVNGNSVAAAVKQLNLWDRTEEPSHIDFVINSPGGHVIAGMALFDALVNMRANGWDITTIARGYAASMGGILLQAGTTRVMGKESYVLIHEMSSVTGGKTSEMEDELEFMKKMQERVLKIFAERAQGKISIATLKRKWKKTDFWLSSDEALKFGIVDEIR